MVDDHYSVNLIRDFVKKTVETSLKIVLLELLVLLNFISIKVLSLKLYHRFEDPVNRNGAILVLVVMFHRILLLHQVLIDFLANVSNGREVYEIARVVEIDIFVRVEKV